MRDVVSPPACCTTVKTENNRMMKFRMGPPKCHVSITGVASSFSPPKDHHLAAVRHEGPDITVDSAVGASSTQLPVNTTRL